MLRKRIIKSLESRIRSEISSRNPLNFMSKLDLEEHADMVFSIIYLFTRTGRKNDARIKLSEIICAIGHGIRNKCKLKRDSAGAAKLGGFILYTFEKLGILKVTLGSGKRAHAQYFVEVINDDAICELWESVSVEKIEKLPSEVPYAPWISTKHETGAVMVKTANKEVLKILTPETHPIVFECLNKAQKVGWQVNFEVYPIYTWAFRNKTDAFSEIWELPNPEARQSKIREAQAIGDIAGKLLNKTFYHLYYYDFRGRKYPTTAYFHEQGSDRSRGLLIRADSKPIGEQGFYWLLISLANNWAGDTARSDNAKTDKIPLADRAAWALDNQEILISYAENPKVNQGWMKADSPWQFLAACFELRKIRTWERLGNPVYEYPSHLECFIDGSNNGSQHLSALTKDEVTAPHVNLVPLPLPGDLYKYVADHVWDSLAEEIDNIPVDRRKFLDGIIDNLIEKKRQISEAQHGSDHRAALIEDILQYKRKHSDDIAEASPVFWGRVVDSKHRRKVVKRNVMTLPYGGTAYGLGQQQIDDARRHNIDLLTHMEHKWGSYLGRKIYTDCQQSLERPMRLLSIFENAGEQADTDKQFLSWTTPITNFPVTQYYVEGAVKKVWVQYGPPKGSKNKTGYYDNTLQLHIAFIEDVVRTAHKQARSASPNAIHSLDACHLMLAVHRADFPVTTIHDSFGCLLGDMPKLFVIIRETFVELYKTDPLTHIMREIGGDLTGVEIGNLDVSLILDSEYAFC